MEIRKLEKFTREQEDRLLAIWEGAVRQTHDFLNEDDICTIKEQVGVALQEIGTDTQGVGEFICAFDGDNILAFMFVVKSKIEMLFVHPDHRGTGIGRKLIEYAVNTLDAEFVDVNEQNTQGVLFYRHMGFSAIGRSDTDDDGRPFPILNFRITK